MKIPLLISMLLTAGVALAQSGKGDLLDATLSPTPEAGEAPAAEPTLDVSKFPFTPASIQKVVAFHQPKIQACYEEVLAKQKKPPEGKLATSFIITPEGMVKKAKVEKKGTTLKIGKLNDCVEQVLTSMTFPKPPDGRDHPVEFPFNLKAVR